MANNEGAISAKRGRSWHANEAAPDVTRRLSRSATITLLLSPVGLLVISVMRLLIITDYNTTTALAVASSGGYVNTLVGTVIPLAPIVLPYVALVLLFSNRVLIAIAALLAVAFTSPTAANKSTSIQLLTKAWHAINSSEYHHIFWLAALFVGLLLAGELLALGYSIFVKTLASIASVILIPIILSLYPLPLNNTYGAQLIRQPWLPAETINLTSGQNLSGYLISEDQDWTVFLESDSRTILYYHTSEIAKRQVCQIGNIPTTAPLISLVPKSADQLPHTPTCPILSP